MVWFVARIIEEGDRFVVTFPDLCMIRAVADTRERAIEDGTSRVDMEIDSWRAKGFVPRNSAALGATPAGESGVSYALIERSARSRNLYNAGGIDQMASFTRSRSRRTTSPCRFLTSRRQPDSSEMP